MSKSSLGLNLSASIHKLKPRKQSDPMILAAKRAYRGSNQHRFDLLVAEERKWKRRRTIANGKLAAVYRKFAVFAKEMCEETLKKIRE